MRAEFGPAVQAPRVSGLFWKTHGQLVKLSSGVQMSPDNLWFLMEDVIPFSLMNICSLTQSNETNDTWVWPSELYPTEVCCALSALRCAHNYIESGSQPSRKTAFKLPYLP